MCTTRREKNSESTEDIDIEWSAEEEIQLFFALGGLKPVGINKHFFMACIFDRLSKALNRDISTDTIWSHLRSMYNLKALDDLEKLPFPNKVEEFSLPETEFSALIVKKKNEIEEQQKKIDIKPIDNGTKINKAPVQQISVASTPTTKIQQNQIKEIDKKVAAKIISASETPKRTPKRTRGSMSIESNSPSTTPPPTQSNKRRRI